MVVVVPWSSRTQPPSSCAWFIFLICLKKYDEKYAKSFLEGVKVCEWDGAVTRPEPGGLRFRISRSVPSSPAPPTGTQRARPPAGWRRPLGGLGSGPSLLAQAMVLVREHQRPFHALPGK